MANLPINRPIKVARDMDASIFENVDISLFELYASGANRGVGMITNRIFRGCRLQGPAIMLVASGVIFEESNFGDSGGDMRNLLLKPMGARALGTVPFRDCLFEGCEFYNVGFTGPQETLDLLASVTYVPGVRQ